MSDEIEYIEPTQEHVGQMVEVKIEASGDWVRRELVGVLPSKMKMRFAYACKNAPNIPMLSYYARIPRPLTYAERQAKCGLKIGDKVRFVRAWEPNEYSTTLEFIHGNCAMNREVGQVGLLTHIGKESMRVQFAAQYWYLPYFVLEKVEDRAATRRDIDTAVYVDGNPQDMFTLEHWYSCDNQPCRAVVRSGDKRFVYELSNLRVKE